VLWTLVLIAFVAGHLAGSGRSEAQVAANLMANATAEAAADGAVNEAIFNILDPRPDRRWALDGTAHELTIGDARIVVRLADDNGRINPNRASPALVEALIEASGSDAETARGLANAIAEWVGTATVFRPDSDIVADYRAAGLDYAPPGRAAETIDELGRIVGMTPAVLAAIRPHLTLFGPAVPDVARADPTVEAALTLLAKRSAGSGQPDRPAIVPYQQRQTARITATAYGPRDAVLTRTAVVEVGAGLPRGYVVLAWQDGVD